MGSIGGDANTSPWYQLPPDKASGGRTSEAAQISEPVCKSASGVSCMRSCKAACPLREEISEKGFDMLIMRELTGGLYFGARRTVVENGVRDGDGYTGL